jgi:hypothetical protein
MTRRLRATLLPLLALTISAAAPPPPEITGPIRAGPVTSGAERVVRMITFA